MQKIGCIVNPVQCQGVDWTWPCSDSLIGALDSTRLDSTLLGCTMITSPWSQRYVRYGLILSQGIGWGRLSSQISASRSSKSHQTSCLLLWLSYQFSTATVSCSSSSTSSCYCLYGTSRLIIIALFVWPTNIIAVLCSAFLRLRCGWRTK